MIVKVDVSALIEFFHSLRRDRARKDYLDKKIKEGKKYQQAIRSLARHLVRVIWKMILGDRDYEIKKFLC